MPQMSVEQFANELGVLPTILLKQLQAAGVSKYLIKESLTEKDKSQLLEYLRKIHVSTPQLQTSQTKKPDSTSKPRSIQLKAKVRKKRAHGSRQFSGIVATQVAALRLEEPLLPFL